MKTAISILRWLQRHWDIPVTVLLALCIVCGGGWYLFRWTSPEEALIRRTVVSTAENYLGYMESDGSHQVIVDIYNSKLPHPRDYEVTYEDSWCAAFGSAVAILCDFTDWIPVECSCGQQIALFDRVGDWEERDWYLPRPGDYIFYDWDNTASADSTGWPDHVGIVVETFGPIIKVIEGNKDDQVAYRYVFLNDVSIRGFGTPDYRKYTATQ